MKVMEDTVCWEQAVGEGMGISGGGGEEHWNIHTTMDAEIRGHIARREIKLAG